MTLELRKTAAVETRGESRRRRVHDLVTTARYTALVVGRRHAWTVWRVLKQLPMTGLLLLAYSPRGLGRAGRAWVQYLRDGETAELRSHHAHAKESGDYVKVSAARSSNLHARLLASGAVVLVALALVLMWTAPGVLAIFTGVAAAAATVKVIPRRDINGLLGAVIAGGVVYFATPPLAALVPPPPPWLLWVGFIGALGGLGWVGRPKAKALVALPAAAQGGQIAPITAPMVMAALCALGNSKMKDPDDLKLLVDPHRNGPGMQVEFELPPPVLGRYVMENREEFAAALRRELGTVWPSVGPRHPGHLIVFISQQVMAVAVQPPWPLLQPGVVIDLGKPFPAFTNQRGEWVMVTLAYASMIIGAVPRMGKTFVLRQMLLAAGLDPRAKVYALDGKGTGDLSCCEHFATFYSRGARTDQPERIERVREAIRGLRRELGRRADVIDSLGKDECPESKVTSELIDARPDLDLGWIVLGIDETQSYFDYGEKRNKEHKEIREELAAGVEELVKLGPALGMIVILATQEVREATIPGSISAQAVIRFCLKIEGHERNDRILGTGAYRRGLDAQMFDIEDKGIGYLKAEGALPQISRSVYGLDAVEADKLGRRARALRIAAGTIRDDDEAVIEAAPVDIVADVRQAIAEHARSSAHLAELVEWLGEMRPDHYTALDVKELGTRLRNRDVLISQVWAMGRNRDGVDLRKQGRSDAA